MNPTKTLDAMLAAADATLIRQGKHNVYSLGNGGRFVMAKTPSDYRSTLNDISELRRRAGLARPIKPTAPQPTAPLPPPIATDYLSLVDQAINPSPAAPTPDPLTPLARHLDELIADGETLMTELTDQAAAIERQVAFLKSIRLQANDPMTAPLLALLVPQSLEQAPPPAAPLPVPTPAAAPSALIIKRDTIREAIANLKQDEFTIEDIYSLLMRERRPLSSYETKPIKKLIGEVLCRICQLDNIIGRVRSGHRGSPTLWTRNVAPTGTRVELSNSQPQQSEPEEIPQETE